jgi:two-component system, NarL family, sensor kinase
VEAVQRLRRWAASPVVQFAASGMLVVALVGVVAGVLIARNARAEALRDAGALARLAGEGIVAPALEPGLLRGERGAIRRLDRVVRARVLRPPVVRVKVWAADGRILYSDEWRLIGERYRLGEDEREVLRAGDVEAELSDLSRPENRFERGRRRLREVYLPLRMPGDGPVLFEEYLSDASISASSRRLWRDSAPVLLGALLALELVQVPLARSLAGRLRRGQREREALLHRAVAASEQERRRIARDLHDGVVQDLAGVSYDLRAAGEVLDRDPGAAAPALRRGGEQVRRAIRQLRTLLVDLYPESLHRQGLAPALSDLLARLDARRITTELAIEPGVELEPAQEALVFRAAQEALRNVTAHADARRVSVRLAREDGHHVLRVADDGRGFSPAADDRPRFGLRMLDDLARDAGGELVVDAAPEGGTVVDLRLPVRRP